LNCTYLYTTARPDAGPRGDRERLAVRGHDADFGDYAVDGGGQGAFALPFFLPTPFFALYGVGLLMANGPNLGMALRQRGVRRRDHRDNGYHRASLFLSPSPSLLC
jgi:hypothetical protein